MWRFGVSGFAPLLGKTILPAAIGLALSADQCVAQELVEGRAAPSVTAQLIDGGKFDLASERGKVVIVNFWATWCVPCREEMPALDAFYRAHKSEGLEILAISMDHSRDLAKVKEVMRSYQFPAALISRSQTRGYGSLWRMPITFMIDRRGALRFDGWKFAGKLDHAMLEKNIIPLLRDGN
jgi:thiol-disulfide isomerase/thioredoxin